MLGSSKLLHLKKEIEETERLGGGGKGSFPGRREMPEMNTEPEAHAGLVRKPRERRPLDRKLTPCYAMASVK